MLGKKNAKWAIRLIGHFTPDGPYECARCGGHITFEDGQFSNVKTCPYCHTTAPVWIAADPLKCELEGPYLCPTCKHSVEFDSTFLEQVDSSVACPYCEEGPWYAEEMM